jgi:diguanylate cyclase (GGDEF)-like protein
VAHVVLPSIILLLIVLVSIRHEMQWKRPTRRLRRLLEDIREGREPIESLDGVGGGLKPLVPQIKQLFHEMRRGELQVAQLNAEIAQRVATRTDALQRTIGSLKAQATRDPLTGLYNRRMLDGLLPRLVERCTRDRLPLAVVAIDVDWFKQLNDTLGHAAGDELLRNIGGLIRSGIREQDAAFRLGGDEFLILLPESTRLSAEGLAGRLVGLVEGLTRTLRLRPAPGISAGVAMLSELEESDAAALLRLADERLYESKSARKASREPVLASSR